MEGETYTMEKNAIQDRRRGVVRYESMMSRLQGETNRMDKNPIQDRQHEET